MKKKKIVLPSTPKGFGNAIKVKPTQMVAFELTAWSGTSDDDGEELMLAFLDIPRIEGYPLTARALLEDAQVIAFAWCEHGLDGMKQVARRRGGRVHGTKKFVKVMPTPDRVCVMRLSTSDVAWVSNKDFEVDGIRSSRPAPKATK